jgi:hypothetical protein
VRAPLLCISLLHPKKTQECSAHFTPLLQRTLDYCCGPRSAVAADQWHCSQRPRSPEVQDVRQRPRGAAGAHGNGGGGCAPEGVGSPCRSARHAECIVGECSGAIQSTDVVHRAAAALFDRSPSPEQGAGPEQQRSAAPPNNLRPALSQSLSLTGYGFSDALIIDTPESARSTAVSARTLPRGTAPCAVYSPTPDRVAQLEKDKRVKPTPKRPIPQVQRAISEYLTLAGKCTCLVANELSVWWLNQLILRAL